MIENLPGDLDEHNKKRFLWGVALAWVPALPLGFTVVGIFRDLSTSRS